MRQPREETVQRARGSDPRRVRQQQDRGPHRRGILDESELCLSIYKKEQFRDASGWLAAAMQFGDFRDALS